MFIRQLNHVAFDWMKKIVRCIHFLNFKPLAIFSGCTAQFVLDLIGNSEDIFSHDVAHIISEN